MNPGRALMSSLAIGLLVCGCSGQPGSPTATKMPGRGHSVAPAEPAVAGPPAVPPAGQVVPLPNAPEGIVIGTSGRGAVAVRNPAAIDLIDTGTGAVRQTIPMNAAARHLSLAGPDGPVLLPLEGSDEVRELSLTDGKAIWTATGVGRQPHDAALTDAGTVAVTNELGGGVVFVRDGAVVATRSAGPVQPGGVAAVGRYAAVADVQGNGVWVYDGSTGRQVAHSPLGVKLTHAVALFGNIAAFSDTDGGEILFERIGPQLHPVAKVDAPGKPYGLAYDPPRRRLYATLTATNSLRVIDISDETRPRILGDVPTVQQPNSVAVDPRSGSVLVTASDAGGRSGLQIIAFNLLPAG